LAELEPRFRTDGKSRGWRVGDSPDRLKSSTSKFA